MPGDVQLTALQIEPAPLDYLVPGSAVVRVKSIRGEFTDNGALADWLPAVQLISDSGHVIATASDQGAKVTAGGSADASFFPGAAKAAAATGAATLAPCALADNGGVGPQSVVSDNSGIYMDFAGGGFTTNDPATYSIVADSGFYGVSSLSIHKLGTYMGTFGVSGQGGGGAGWTAANVATTFLEVLATESSPNCSIDYVFNSPDGGYGFDPPLPAGGFWWSSREMFTMHVSGDMGTHPVVARVIQAGGHTLSAYCALFVTKISDTVL